MVFARGGVELRMRKDCVMGTKLYLRERNYGTLGTVGWILKAIPYNIYF